MQMAEREQEELTKKGEKKQKLHTNLAKSEKKKPKKHHLQMSSIIQYQSKLKTTLLVANSLLWKQVV